MDRIAIIGCGGSGKTRLAHHLAGLLNLPLTHLDGLYYDAEWCPLPREEIAALQCKLVAQPRRLIEGNYTGALLAIRRLSVITGSPAPFVGRWCLRRCFAERCNTGRFLMW